jgi:iron(III) transport system substrate-binding protein
MRLGAKRQKCGIPDQFDFAFALNELYSSQEKRFLRMEIDMAQCFLKNLLRNGFLTLVAWAATLALPGAVQAQSQDALKAEWGRVVAAARKEGKVVIYSDPGREKIYTDYFEPAFPGIKAEIVSGNRLSTRIAAERRTDKFIPDVYLAGASYGDYPGLRGLNAFLPIRPALLVPEVLDESKWFEGKLWFADEEEKYILMFSLQTATKMAVNTNLVNPAELTSYKQLLDPKWRGKIVSSDVTAGGQGGGNIRYLYLNPRLGPDFLRKLYGEMDVTLSRDDRQSIDWLAQGRFAILLFPAWLEVTRAKEAGLPVETVNAQQMEEGYALTTGPNNLYLMNLAPNPNAAKVFANWFLSRDGQMAFEKVVQSPSLRVDTPTKELLQARLVPKKGGNYMVSTLHKYSRSDPEIRKLLTSLKK